MRFPPFADLDKDQRSIYADSPIEGALLVTGPPGTGKTVIAMHRALRLAAGGERVSIIMFNKVLARYTSNFEGMPRNVEVSHGHKWFPRWYKGAFGTSVPRVSKFIFDWDQVRKNIASCSSLEILRRLNWGHLIVDEGQDFPPKMYRALMEVILHPKMPGESVPTLTVFADENQAVFENNSAIVELIEELNTTVQRHRLWRLDKNYRNSREIAKFAKYFQVRGSSSVALPDRETSSLPTIFVHLDEDSPYNQISNFATNFGALEVGVIVFGTIKSVTRAYNGIKERVESNGLACRVQCYVSNYWDRSITNVENLYFDSPPSITVVHAQSAKGLEFDAVFLLNLSALEPRDSGELDSFKKLYVSSSRARSQLFALITGSVEEGFLPDSMRLLPDPTASLCEYAHTEDVGLDLEKLLYSVDWSDSAYQYQRSMILDEGLIERIQNLEREKVSSALVKVAEQVFYKQATATIVNERLDNKEHLLDLVIELGPNQVRQALSLEPNL